MTLNFNNCNDINYNYIITELLQNNYNNYIVNLNLSKFNINYNYYKDITDINEYYEFLFCYNKTNLMNYIKNKYNLKYNPHKKTQLMINKINKIYYDELNYLIRLLINNNVKFIINYDYIKIDNNIINIFNIIQNIDTLNINNIKDIKYILLIKNCTINNVILCNNKLIYKIKYYNNNFDSLSLLKVMQKNNNINHLIIKFQNVMEYYNNYKYHNETEFLKYKKLECFKNKYIDIRLLYSYLNIIKSLFNNIIIYNFPDNLYDFMQEKGYNLKYLDLSEINIIEDIFNLPDKCTFLIDNNKLL
jgi:hypothetical protein